MHTLSTIRTLAMHSNTLAAGINKAGIEKTITVIVVPIIAMLVGAWIAGTAFRGESRKMMTTVIHLIIGVSIVALAATWMAIGSYFGNTIFSK